MVELEQLVAQKLIQLKAIKMQAHNPFIWANGWESPIYMDDRKVLSYPQMRDFLKLELGRIVAEQFPDVDVIAGVAINAIAHGLLVAEQLSLPFVYVHPKPKDHGLENRIEGDLRPRQNVVVIENQIIEGTAAYEVIKTLRENGCNVLGLVTIFDYQFKGAQKKLKEAGIEVISLTNIQAALKQAVTTGYVNEEDSKILKKWLGKH